MHLCQILLPICPFVLLIRISFAFPCSSRPQHVHWPNGGAFEYAPPMGLAMNGDAPFTGRRALVPLGRATYFGPSFGHVPSFRSPGISSAVGRFGPNAYKTNSIVSPMLFGRGGLRSAGFEFVNPNFGPTSFGTVAARPLAQQQFSFVGKTKNANSDEINAILVLNR